jgi:hypothetical protein
MSFRAFIRKFSPPLGQEDIDRIVQEHEKRIRAVEASKQEGSVKVPT